MHVVERKEDDNVGDEDYDDVVEDVVGATYADAGALCFFLSTTDVGGRLWGGVVDIKYVTDADG